MLRRYACGCCASDQERRAAQVFAGSEGSDHESEEQVAQRVKAQSGGPFSSIRARLFASPSNKKNQNKKKEKKQRSIQQQHELADQDGDDAVSGQDGKKKGRCGCLCRVIGVGGRQVAVAPDGDDASARKKRGGLGAFLGGIMTWAGGKRLGAKNGMTPSLIGDSALPQLVHKTSKLLGAGAVSTELQARKAEYLKDFEHLVKGTAKSGVNRAIGILRRMHDEARRKRIAHERQAERRRKVEEAKALQRLLLPPKMSVDLVDSQWMPAVVKTAAAKLHVMERERREKEERLRRRRERDQLFLERQAGWDAARATITCAVFDVAQMARARLQATNVLQRAIRAYWKRCGEVLHAVQLREARLKAMRERWRRHWQGRLRIATAGLWAQRRAVLAKRQARLDLLAEVRARYENRQSSEACASEDPATVAEAYAVPYEHKVALRLPARDADPATVPILPATSPRSKAVLNWVGVPVGFVSGDSTDTREEEDEKSKNKLPSSIGRKSKNKKGKKKKARKQSLISTMSKKNSNNNNNNNNDNDDNDGNSGAAMVTVDQEEEHGNRHPVEDSRQRRRRVPRSEQIRLVYQPVPRSLLGLRFSQSRQQPRERIDAMEAREKRLLDAKHAVHEGARAELESGPASEFFSEMSEDHAALYEAERRRVLGNNSVLH